MAWEFIGHDWYQWNSHGDPSPHVKYDIRIAVYSSGSQSDIQAHYPIIPEQLCDYRFVARDDALTYLEERLLDVEAVDDTELRESLKQLLLATRQKIQTYFKPNP
jgi:hypothetical protein